MWFLLRSGTDVTFHQRLFSTGNSKGCFDVNIFPLKNANTVCDRFPSSLGRNVNPANFGTPSRLESLPHPPVYFAVPRQFASKQPFFTPHFGLENLYGK